MLIDFRKLFPKYGIKPNGVLHVGANVGEEAPVYNELNCGHVSWVEANHELIPQLSNNVKQYNHCVFNYCVSDVDDQEITFHISNNAGQSSSMLELGTHKTAHPEVHYVKDLKLKTKRLDSLFREGKLPTATLPDFLNIDLQGAELKALKGMGDMLHYFKWAYLEVNKAELYKGCALVEEIDTYLLGFGFKRVETFWCGNTGWGDALYIKGR